MMSQPHEYTSLQADRASIGPGPLSKQVSFLGQRDKEAVSPYMAFMRKQFSFGGSQTDAESSDNTTDEQEDDEEGEGDNDDGDNDRSVNGSTRLAAEPAPATNKMSGLFRPLSSLIEKARSVSRGRTRGGQDGESPDNARSESRSRQRANPDADPDDKARSVSRGKARDSQKGSTGTSESRGKIRSGLDAESGSGERSESPGPAREKKSLLRSSMFGFNEDD